MSDTNKKDETAVSNTRRSFFNIIWAGLGILAVAEFIVVVIAFLGRQKSGKYHLQTGELLEVGDADNFPLNSVTANIQGRFYLCRMEDGGFLALLSKCTHLGCTVSWDDKENRFICPCHGSSFDITGTVITSPAPRPLDTYQVHIENNLLKVDTENIIRRSEFNKKQLVYTKKGKI